MINTAMVLSAGLGTRLRPLTDHMPKPLLKFGAKPMLDHVLDQLADAGVTRAVVNVHYLAEQVIAHVQKRSTPQITISDERKKLLESGGGIRHALPALNAEVFFTVNADALWHDQPGYIPALQRMMAFWNPEIMDTLMLLSEKSQAVGFDGPGDYFIAPDGKLSWRGDHAAAPYVYASVTIAKAPPFRAATDAVFSQKRIWDTQEKSGRLYGIVHDGPWYHCSTPADFAAVNAAIGNGF